MRRACISSGPQRPHPSRPTAAPPPPPPHAPDVVHGGLGRAEQRELLRVAHELQAGGPILGVAAGAVDLLHAKSRAHDVSERPVLLAIELEDEAEHALAVLVVLGVRRHLVHVVARHGDLGHLAADLRAQLQRRQVVVVQDRVVRTERCGLGARAGAGEGVKGRFCAVRRRRHTARAQARARTPQVAVTLVVAPEHRQVQRRVPPGLVLLVHVHLQAVHLDRGRRAAGSTPFTHSGQGRPCSSGELSRPPRLVMPRPDPCPAPDT